MFCQIIKSQCIEHDYFIFYSKSYFKEKQSLMLAQEAAMGIKYSEFSFSLGTQRWMTSLLPRHLLFPLTVYVQCTYSRKVDGGASGKIWEHTSVLMGV